MMTASHLLFLQISLILPSSHMFSHSCTALNALIPCPCTGRPADSVPWLHQTFQKSSHHDQTTGWPRLHGNVIFTRSSQCNPFVCVCSSRYSIPLCTGSSARVHATPVLLTIRQSGSHLSIHSCTSACLSSLIGSHTSLLFLLFRNDPFIHIVGSPSLIGS